jgi:hypothetical protein
MKLTVSLSVILNIIKQSVPFSSVNKSSVLSNVQLLRILAINSLLKFEFFKSFVNASFN